MLTVIVVIVLIIILSPIFFSSNRDDDYANVYINGFNGNRFSIIKTTAPTIMKIITFTIITKRIVVTKLSFLSSLLSKEE